MVADAFPTTQSMESARALVRYVRGQIGTHNRKFAIKPKAAGKAGEIPPMPPSLAEPFMPYVVEGCKRVGVLSDIHVPYHSPGAVEAAVKQLKANAIDTLILNGDFADFYTISRHEKDPSMRDFPGELRMIREMLAYLRASFPKAKIIAKEGNHEFRWDSYIWSRAPELAGVPEIRMPELLKLKDMRIEWVADKRPVMVGKLPLLHGHELPHGFTPAVNPARGAFLRTIHSVMVGHHHRTSTHVEPDMEGREIAVWSTGCLCDMKPAYAVYNKWNHGFAYVSLDKDGDYGVENYRISADWKVRTS
jgi:predicted phosphodiesterase